MQISDKDFVEDWNLIHCNKCGWTGDLVAIQKGYKCCKNRVLSTIGLSMEGVFLPWEEKQTER